MISEIGGTVGNEYISSIRAKNLAEIGGTINGQYISSVTAQNMGFKTLGQLKEEKVSIYQPSPGMA